MKVWLNDRLVPKEKAVVSVFDRGFLYGDGIYETMRVYDGVVFHLKDHLARLADSAAGIKMLLPWSNEYLENAIYKVIKTNHLRDASTRLTISRGPGDIGYNPPQPFRPTLAIMTRAFKGYPDGFYRRGIKIVVVNIRRNYIKSLDPGIKSANCLNGILAKFEAVERGAFEGVMLNVKGYLSEGTVSALFVVKNGGLFTPPLSAGILPGITRRVVMELADSLNVNVTESNMKPDRLYGADEVFLASTNMEVLPVVKVGDRAIGQGVPGPVTKSLIRAFRHYVGSFGKAARKRTDEF